jgi:CheY-like chemotaxis protein
MTTILLVEDNISFRQSLKKNLEDHFPRIIVEEAGEGQEALPKIQSDHPELIFLDIKLPGESGLELARKIKSTHAEIVVAMLTSYDLPEYREAAHQSGANYFFAKGTSPWEEILTLVRDIDSLHKTV